MNLSKAYISTDNFRNGWKKMREAIAVGISSIHFGHLKAITQSESLSNFEAMICHIPYQTGYSPVD